MPKKLKLQQETPSPESRDYYGVSSNISDYKLNYFLQKITNGELVHLSPIETNDRVHERTMLVVNNTNIVVLENKKAGGVLLPKLKMADYVIAIAGDETDKIIELIKSELQATNFVQTIFAVQADLITLKNNIYFDTTHF